MPQPDPPPSNFQEMLSEVHRQQRLAVESYQLLTQQHELWQQTVMKVLMQADRTVSARVAIADDGSASGSPPLLSATCGLIEPEFPEPTELPPESAFSLSLPTEGFGDSTKVQPGLLSSVESSFQTSSQRGPLKKLVAEILRDQEASRRRKELTFWHKLQHKVAEFVLSKWFEYITGLVILLNMVTIGVEAELSLSHVHEDTWAAQAERFFLALFTIEIVLRIIGLGKANLKQGWFYMDFLLVSVGLLARVIIPMFGAGVSLAGFETLLLVRCLRLLRLVRALRMISHFKVMWRLVYSLLTAGQTMLSTAILILLALFIFGCVALEFITKDAALRANPDTEPIVRDFFSNLPRAVLTLTQFVTLDSIAGIYYPLIVQKPVLILYFGPILFIVSIGLMNLITAVLVENSLEHAAHEAETERLQMKTRIKEALPALLNAFQELDADGSGCLTKEEVENVPIDILPAKMLETISIDSMPELFDLLDVDCSGQLDQTEFVEGLLNLVLLDVPISTIQSLRLLRLLRSMSQKLDRDVQALHSLVTASGVPVRI